MFTYTLGSGTLAWPVVPELLPLHARINGASVAAICNWLFVRDPPGSFVLLSIFSWLTFYYQNFLLAMVAPIMVANLGWKTYIVWTCTNFVSVPVLYLFMPEVKNLTLEEVDLIFTDHTQSPVQAAKKLQKMLIDNGGDHGREIMFQKMSQAAKEEGLHEQSVQYEGNTAHVDAKRPVEHIE